MYEVDKIQYLQIGVQGENDATDIEIDMSAWAEKYPDAQFHILFKPYNASEPSPMLTTYEDGVLTWTVGAGATAVTGVGYTEIRAQDAETGLVKKTKIIPTSVENSVSGVETDPPASYQEWVTNVLNAGTAAVNANTAAQAAKTAAETARDAAQAAAGDFQDLSASVTGLAAGASPTVDVTHSEGGYYNLAFGIPKGDKGDQGDPAPADQVVPAVNSYLEQVITNPDSPPLDRNLSSNASAAPADMVGDLKSALKVVENEFIDTEELTPTILSQVGYYSGTLTSTSGWTDGDKYSVFQYELVVGKKYFISEPYNYYAFSNSDYSSGMTITKIDVTDTIFVFTAEKKYLYVYRTSPSHQTANNTIVESMDNKVDDIEIEIDNMSDDIEGKRKITKYGCVRQSLNSEGEPGSASTTRIYTSKIPISEVKAINGIAGYDFTIYAFGDGGTSLGYYYNGSFSKSTITWVEGKNTLYVSNLGIKSLRVYVKEHNSATITIDEIAGITLEIDNNGQYNWFKGKKWYAIGDSITYGTYSKSDGTIARNPAISYPNVCSGLIDYDLVNLGVPNLGFTVNATDSSFTDQTLPDVLTNHTFEGAELVTIALGTNDYGRNGTLGTIADASSVNSIYGRIKLIVETLMTKCPKARIIFFTPIPREKVGSANSQYDKTVQNASGFTFNAVKNAIIEACEYYAIEYINLTDTFVLNYANHTTYQKDNLHPTIDGHALMAKCLASKLVF